MPWHAFQLDGVEALRATAAAWDDLWLRSAVTLPTLRAEPLAQWCMDFAPRQRFAAVVVADGAQYLAALPLLAVRWGRCLPVGCAPGNAWSTHSDLLLDADLPAAAADAVLDGLVAAAERLPWRLLWLDEIPGRAPRWQALHAALRRRRMPAALAARYSVPQIAVPTDWEAYRAAWSRKHRQRLAHAERELARRGALRLVLHTLPGEALERQMAAAFAVEDRSWKGAAGTSILRTPGMATFFQRQAALLAAQQHWLLALLTCADAPVAFAFGPQAKGVFHSFKVGYDAAFAPHSPGQLLRRFLLEAFTVQRSHVLWDCQGPLTPAHACWLPRAVSAMRLVAARPTWLGHGLLRAYADWWPRLRGRSITRVEASADH